MIYRLRKYANQLTHALAMALALSMTLLPGNAAAQPSSEEPSAGIMMFDAVVARPLLLATTVAGTGLYVVTLPFTLAGGNAKQAGAELVVGPAKNTFYRCLGCIHTGYQKD